MQHLVSLLLLVIFCIGVAEAARGGSYSARGSSSYRGSSYRSSSYRSRSYRSTTYSRYGDRTVSNLVRHSFSNSAKRSLLKLGIAFTSYRWLVRYGRGYNTGGDGSYYDDSVTFCFNIKDPIPAKYNSTRTTPWLYENKTVLGVFACPMGEYDDQYYCCGSADRQTCCNFFEDSSRLIKFLAGLTVGLFCMLMASYWVYTTFFKKSSPCKNCKKKSRTSPCSTDVGLNATSSNSNNAVIFPGQAVRFQNLAANVPAAPDDGHRVSSPPPSYNSAEYISPHSLTGGHSFGNVAPPSYDQAVQQESALRNIRFA